MRGVWWPFLAILLNVFWKFCSFWDSMREVVFCQFSIFSFTCRTVSAIFYWMGLWTTVSASSGFDGRHPHPIPNTWRSIYPIEAADRKIVEICRKASAFFRGGGLGLTKRSGVLLVWQNETKTSLKETHGWKVQRIWSFEGKGFCKKMMAKWPSYRAWGA